MLGTSVGYQVLLIESVLASTYALVTENHTLSLRMLFRCADIVVVGPGNDIHPLWLL